MARLDTWMCWDLTVDFFFFFLLISASFSRCHVINSTQVGATFDIKCDETVGGMDGRYVNIMIPGIEKILTLCEVEVYGSRLD